MKWIEGKYCVQYCMLGRFQLGVVSWSSVRGEEFKASLFTGAKQTNFHEEASAKAWVEQQIRLFHEILGKALA